MLISLLTSSAAKQRDEMVKKDKKTNQRTTGRMIIDLKKFPIASLLGVLCYLVTVPHQKVHNEFKPIAGVPQWKI
jgi:hypothetical protein